MAAPVAIDEELRCQRLPGLLACLEHGLIERRREVRLALLAALAGEHTLLIGPPGTAKSELARRLHLAFRDARYFERLLTRFSVPEELFGPLSISALEQDRYERQTAGFLPQAGIAFIDEVFKANSAILNALLTLLNERKFDNGAGREDCPLISVIGATNEVPEGEVSDAFFDRFLIRLPVTPVSADGFARLLAVDSGEPPGSPAALDAGDRRQIAEAAARLPLPAPVGRLLAELRDRQQEAGVYVSDRRWVKIVHLLRIAAASEGREAVSIWDLWLLPWCAAADPAGQSEVDDWLCQRLGVRAGWQPPRLARVVEAFVAQARLEHEADDLDYGEDGRLRFGAELDGQVGDAKGAGQALRMSFRKQRRYGAIHVEARLRQVDDLVERIRGYREEVAAWRNDLATYRQQGLWLDHAFADRADSHLATTIAEIDRLRQEALAARDMFLALPRLAERGVEPTPVEHELLES